MTDVTFSKNVGTIGEGVFDSCRALKSVAFLGDVGSIGSEAFSDCRVLTSVTFSGEVDTIGQQAFYNCNLLTRFALPEGLTSLGEEAFEDCGGLTAVYLPATLQTVGDTPFYRCEELRDVYFGGTAEQWEALGGSKLLNSIYAEEDPVVHFQAQSVFPDTDAGDLDTLKRRIADGVGFGRTDIELTASMDLGGATLTIPKDCNVVLDLKGHTLTSSASPAINLLGDLTILDSTAADAPTVTSGSSVT